MPTSSLSCPVPFHHRKRIAKVIKWLIMGSTSVPFWMINKTLGFLIQQKRFLDYLFFLLCKLALSTHPIKFIICLFNLFSYFWILLSVCEIWPLQSFTRLCSSVFRCVTLFHDPCRIIKVDLKFPPKPVVSSAAKDLISQVGYPFLSVFTN